MTITIEERVNLASFRLSEALEDADKVTIRCGDTKVFTMPSWEEYFALRLAAREAKHVLDSAP